MRKRDGKVATKLKWYGGLVTRVSTGGSKIRIKYDDGTSEVSKFPDKDVIVDETGNGTHRVAAGRFILPALRAPAAREEKAEQVKREKQKEEVVEKKPKKMERSLSKALKEPKNDEKEEKEATMAELDSKRVVSTPPAKSLKKARSVSASKKRPPASPKSPPALPKRNKEEEEDTKDGVPEEKHNESDTAKEANDDVNEAPVDSESSPEQTTTKRKKPTLKIRLKGPKPSIVATGSHESEKEEEHGDDSAYEEEPMSVDGEQVQANEDDNDDGEDDTSKGDTESAEESNTDNEFARKKRAYDSVSGDDTPEEPPTKKRAPEEVVPITEPMETEADKSGHEEEQHEAESADEKPSTDLKDKVSDANEEVGDIDSSDRKRKRDEKQSPSASPRAASDSPIHESKQEKEPEADKSEAVPSTVVTMKVDSKEVQVDDDKKAEEVSESKSSLVDQTDLVAHEEPSEKVSEEPDATHRANTPSPVAEEEDDGNDDESTTKPTAIATIPRFGRRAAQQANERIAARKERIIVDEFAKKKKQRKEKADLKLLSPDEPKTKQSEYSDDEVEGNWVQCDNCKKWRILPSSVDTSELPLHWYCEMNTFDPERSRCSAPEQSDQEILKEKRRRRRKLAKIARLEAAGKIDAETAAAQRLALDNKERKSGKGRGRVARSPKPSKDALESEPDASKGKRKKRSSPTLDDEATEDAESPTDDGDQQKSRSFKKQPSFGSRRSSKSEVEDAGNAEPEAETEPVPKKRGRGRPPRARTNKDADKGKSGKGDPDNQVSSLTSIPLLSHRRHSLFLYVQFFSSQEWVACEKCQKWRRLPSHISASSLPDVWYCSMNTWDSRAATCDAAEDKADPNHHEFGIYGSGVSTASYGNKLSYRNLIFGTGRKQNRPITERTRAAESLFLAPSDPSSDGVSYPKVMYANSSVFMPRLSNAQKAHAPDIEQKMSLFDLMNHSNLWAELRASSNEQPDKPGSAVVDSGYDELSDEMKRIMKNIALHAIGSGGALRDDEILLEAQCRQWNDVPREWAEIRASCTIEMVQGAIRDLLADGRIEVISDREEGDTLAAPKYRCVSATRPTRCMKIAKPWKAKSGRREWDDRGVIASQS